MENEFMRATMLRGISGSGKSHLAREMVAKNPNLVHIERDMIRAFVQNRDVYDGESWYVDDSDPSAEIIGGVRAREALVTMIQRQQIRYAAQAGRDVVIADTHLNTAHTSAMYNFLLDVGYLPVIVDVTVSLALAKQRNKERSSNRVPEKTMERQYRSFKEIRNA
jgi:predicted kinase